MILPQVHDSTVPTALHEDPQSMNKDMCDNGVDKYVLKENMHQKQKSGIPPS